MKYNWQQKEWKKFYFDFSKIEELIHLFYEKTGVLKGSIASIPEDQKNEAFLTILVSEAIKNSEIEGEFLSKKDVMSSIKKNLGLGDDTTKVKDVNAKGMANLVTEIRNNYATQLSKEMIFEWHKMIFSANTKINVGQWRFHTEPMQIVSGAIGKEIIHFEAPPSKEVEKEMTSFIRWFNETEIGGKNEIKHAPIRCAIAHLYFESIHPLEDGNGRIGRAIAEKSLLQSLGYLLPFSLSSAIELDKKEYYKVLKQGQRSNEITEFLIYFIQVIINSMDNSTAQIHFILQKARLFKNHQSVLNKRQIKVLNKMMENGPSEFIGGMSAKKYISIAKTSKATATRDLQHLVNIGILNPVGAGRSSSYSLSF